MFKLNNKFSLGDMTDCESNVYVSSMFYKWYMYKHTYIYHLHVYFLYVFHCLPISEGVWSSPTLESWGAMRTLLEKVTCQRKRHRNNGFYLKLRCFWSAHYHQSIHAELCYFHKCPFYHFRASLDNTMEGRFANWSDLLMQRQLAG